MHGGDGTLTQEIRHGDALVDIFERGMLESEGAGSTSLQGAINRRGVEIGTREARQL